MKIPQQDVSQLLIETETALLGSTHGARDPQLSALIQYHLKTGGHRSRARLALEAGHALGLAPDVSVTLAIACELLHNASLLHDDIQDGDEERRGRPSAWVVFDINTALCAGSLLMSAAYARLARLPSGADRLIVHTHMRTADLISGQARDLQSSAQAGPDQPSLLSPLGYIETARLKSGSLLALPLELALLAAGKGSSSVAVARLAGESFAVAYQIADDIADREADLARGSCNLVGILQREGLDPETAVNEAIRMAQTQLAIARSAADEIPQQGGRLLRQMVEALEVNLIQQASACESA